jgi:hypothetical protein
MALHTENQNYKQYNSTSSHFKVLILDALAEHELKALGGRVMMVMQDARLDTT